MVKIENIQTKSYSKILDSMIDENVFIKAKLVKRLTYGEYIGEPNNGFELNFVNDNPSDDVEAIDLGRADVYIEASEKELTKEQKLILNWLIENPVEDAPMMTIANFIAGNKWVQLPVDVGNAYGHMTGKEDIEIMEAFVKHLKEII